MVFRGKSRKSTKTTEPNRPSPVSRIDKIASLKRYPDKDYALDLLHQMAKAVAPLVNEYKLKVGTLCEMFPKDASLLGLNVNRGQKILIRLRPSHNDRLFLPNRDLIDTLLHELTHNVHGPHDARFYAFLDELRQKYETGTFLAKDYVCEENKLGSGFTPPWATPQSIREKRLQALSKGKFNAEVRKVGGKAPAAGDLRKVMFKAAERRLRDSKWCSQTRPPEDELKKADLEIQELALIRNSIHSAANHSYKEIIDLTQDEVGDDDDIEIIEVEAYKRSKFTSNPKPSVLEEFFFPSST